MKKIILLFCFAICAALSYGQVKVVSTGFTKVGATGTAPAEQLDVTGNVRVGVSPSAYAEFVNANSNVFQINKITSAGQSLIDISPQPLDGSSNASFRYFRQTSTTGAVKFDVHYGDGSNGVNARITGKGNSYVNKNTGNFGVGLTNPSTKLDVAGDISINGVVKVTSDLATKKNVSDFSGGLEEVLGIRPITFQYNGKAATNNNGQTYVGVAAQELQKVAPYLVEEFTFIDEDSEGNILEQSDYLRINDSEIKYLLINAIQEQQEMIEAQNEAILSLKETIESIGSVESVNNSSVTLSSYDLAELDQNRPNPFNSNTSINYVVPTDAQTAIINIYGANGQVMKTLAIDHVGEGSLDVKAENLPSGTYSYQLIVDGRSVATHKMMIAK